MKLRFGPAEDDSSAVGRQHLERVEGKVALGDREAARRVRGRGRPTETSPAGFFLGPTLSLVSSHR